MFGAAASQSKANHVALRKGVFSNCPNPTSMWILFLCFESHRSFESDDSILALFTTHLIPSTWIHEGESWGGGVG